MITNDEILSLNMSLKVFFYEFGVELNSRNLGHNFDAEQFRH